MALGCMRSFVDGWVEFETKKEAKHVALLLNGHAVGAQPSLTQQILCARPGRHGAPNSERSACLLTRGACASLFVTNVRRAGKEAHSSPPLCLCVAISTLQAQAAPSASTPQACA